MHGTEVNKEGRESCYDYGLARTVKTAPATCAAQPPPQYIFHGTVEWLKWLKWITLCLVVTGRSATQHCLFVAFCDRHRAPGYEK